MKAHTILFPTDFSDIASNALDFAADWARQMDGELLLLHVNTNPYGAPAQESDPLPLDTVNNRLINSKLESLLQDLQTKYGIRTRTLIEEGQPQDTIPKIAETADVSLIVMGTEGAVDGVASHTHSLTAKVIERTVRPLLVIPREATFQPLRKWVYATDLQDREDLSLNQIMALASGLNAHLELLHVRKNAEDEGHVGTYLDSFRQKYRLPNLSFTLIEHRNVLEGIDQYVQQNQPDLLILARHRHNFLENMLQRKPVHYSVTHTNFPLLVIYEPKEGAAEVMPQSATQS